jgi:hypothetical protein
VDRPDVSTPSGAIPRAAGFNTEVVERVIAGSTRKLGVLEPARRKLFGAISHVLAAEHTEAKHFGWRQIRLELWVEVATDRFDEFVAVASLHPIIDSDRSSHLLQAGNALSPSEVLFSQHSHEDTARDELFVLLATFNAGF